MVSLVEKGWANQKEITRAFGCSTRNARRYQYHLDAGGLPALGRARGYPCKGLRVLGSRERLLGRLKTQGMANKEIARWLGVTPKAIGKLFKRIRWCDPEPEQSCIQIPDPRRDPKLSDFSSRMSGETPE